MTFSWFIQSTLLPELHRCIAQGQLLDNKKAKITIDGIALKYKGQVDRYSGKPSGMGVAKKRFKKYSGIFFEGSPLICKDSSLNMYGEYKDGKKFGKQTKY